MIENPAIKREAVPVIFKIIADAEIQLRELTGCNVSLEMKLHSPVITKEELIKLTIQSLVVSEFGITWPMMLDHSRTRNLVDARKAYCYIANVIAGINLSATGRDLNRDHTSIIHLRNSAKGLIETNDPIKIKIENIKTKLYEYLN